MPGFGSRCLLCAIVMMLACPSAAKARSWRYYSYHWYGHTWSNPNRGNDERRSDESAPRAEDKSDLRNRAGDFGSAIERMIRACDEQVVELKKMPLDSVAQIVKPAEDQRIAHNRQRCQDLVPGAPGTRFRRRRTRQHHYCMRRSVGWAAR